MATPFKRLREKTLKQSNILHVNKVGENAPTRADRPPTPGISPKRINRLFFRYSVAGIEEVWGKS